jgi:hypothetical protein
MTTKRDRFRDIQGRLHDPALTALTIALAFLMFAVGPLQAVGVLGAHHFSFVTLTSVGYGDIVPVHPYARSLANVEAIIGQLYPATLLARLVTLEIADRQR